MSGPCPCGRPHHARGLCTTCYHKAHPPLNPRPPCSCGRPHHAHGLCRSCYQKSARPLPPVVSLQERNDRLAAAKERFPSTQMDMVDWFVAFLDDNVLFNRILDDMASITGRQIRRGRLHLDHRGREIGSSASVAVQGGTET